ncbi:DUF4153 domain-containing protein [Phenylobacterium deserti]|nr:DUF4153 domain-containing protein [Phenylobacterium deserti]
MGEGEQPAARRLIAVRLAIGAVQGLALYALSKAPEGGPRALLAGLNLAALFTPVVLLGGYGVLRARVLMIWSLAAAALCGALAAYDVAFGQGPEQGAHWPSAPLILFLGAALFIVHHLIGPADGEGRWRASYGRYFDDGWRDGVRLVLAAAFVGALWLLLALAAALFGLIGLEIVGQLIQRGWFAIPVTTLFFAMAIHLTDVRAALVRGARTLGLTLLAWLAPVMTLIAAGFLLSLPFTGLAPLWETGKASPILLGAAAALIILINAAYQDGERPDFPPAVLRWTVRAASLVLVPLALIALYGVGLRVAQRGLTPDRIYALVCLVPAAVYGFGYAWAAVTRGPWMRRLEPTNIVAAHLVVALIVLVFSPVIDPVRLSVNDQVDRLRSGKVSAELFDYSFLRWDAGDRGKRALQTLARDGAGADPAAVRARAAAALARQTRSTQEVVATAVTPAKLQVVGAALPADFLSQTAWPQFEEPTRSCGHGENRCLAFVIDLAPNPGAEVAILGAMQQGVYGRTPEGWRQVGSMRLCAGELQALKAGRFRWAQQTRPVLEIAGRARAFEPLLDCDRAAAP